MIFGKLDIWDILPPYKPPYAVAAWVLSGGEEGNLGLLIFVPNGWEVEVWEQRGF